MKTSGFILIIIIGLALVYILPHKGEYNTDGDNPCGMKVSLPEEIMEAQEGDLLIVEKVGDSIYIGFKHSNINNN